MTLFRVFRDVVTFLAGLVLAGYEVLTTPDGADPSLIVLGLAATMMGLPGSLGIDRLLQRGDAAPPPPAPADEDPAPEPQRRRHSR